MTRGATFNGRAPAASWCGCSGCSNSEQGELWKRDSRGNWYTSLCLIPPSWRSSHEPDRSAPLKKEPRPPASRPDGGQDKANGVSGLSGVDLPGTPGLATFSQWATGGYRATVDSITSIKKRGDRQDTSIRDSGSGVYPRPPLTQKRADRRGTRVLESWGRKIRATLDSTFDTLERKLYDHARVKGWTEW